MDGNLIDPRTGVVFHVAMTRETAMDQIVTEEAEAVALTDGLTFTAYLLHLSFGKLPPETIMADRFFHRETGLDKPAIEAPAGAPNTALGREVASSH